ncbi:MAG: VOC family protein [Bacteroidetes bacterium]|nr:VOC family protein [Bacteroidota bacterium]
MSTPIRFTSTLITVSDMNASRDFYERLLGQEVEYDFGENLSFKGGFALHERRHFHRLLASSAAGRDHAISEDAAAAQREGAGRYGGQRRYDMELYFECEDIGKVDERLRAAGIPFVHPLREQPWAQRVVRVFDPDGTIVEIGEPMPLVVLRLAREGTEETAIAERTSIPLRHVQLILAQEAVAQETLFG